MNRRSSPRPEAKTGHLLGELKRRRVLYAAGVYGVSAFAVTEIATFVFENFGVPAWANRLLAALFVAGFPAAMFLSWVFDIRADGIVRSPAGAHRNPGTLIVLALLLLVVATSGLFYLIFPDDQPTDSGQATVVDTADATEMPAKLERSIAVLPFANLSPDPDNAYFCDGISEEILNRLGTLSERLNIIGRTSSFVFKDRDVDIPQIANALGVRYLLQGSVRRAGTTLRISAQLLDDQGLQVWSQSFDRELDDVFAIQKEIADHVAGTILPHVITSAHFERAPLIDAYESYLRGRELMHKRQKGQAREAFETAIELDPDFAEAHAELAVVDIFGFPSEEQAEQVRRSIDRALALKPGLLRAREALGLLHDFYNEPARSEAVFRGVLGEDPNRTEALLWLANLLREEGRPDEANEFLHRAYRIDPLHATITVNLANQLFARGQATEAKRILRRIIENVPDTRYAPYLLAGVYRNEGRLVESIDVLKRAALHRAIPHYWHLAMNYAVLGDWASMAFWLDRSAMDFPDFVFIPFLPGQGARWQGQYDRAAQLTVAAWNPGFESSGFARAFMGETLSMAGRHAEAIEILEAFLMPPDQASQPYVHANVDLAQNLVWSLQQTGQPERAASILATMDEHLREGDRAGALGTLRVGGFNDGMYRDAMNARLMGQLDLALDRLERAAAYGWSDFYIQHHDPRWDVLRDHPRFQAVMAEVRARVDTLAAEVARIDAETDFRAAFEARMAEAPAAD